MLIARARGRVRLREKRWQSAGVFALYSFCASSYSMQGHTQQRMPPPVRVPLSATRAARHPSNKRLRDVTFFQGLRRDACEWLWSIACCSALLRERCNVVVRGAIAATAYVLIIALLTLLAARVIMPTDVSAQQRRRAPTPKHYTYLPSDDQVGRADDNDDDDNAREWSDVIVNERRTDDEYLTVDMAAYARHDEPQRSTRDKIVSKAVVEHGRDPKLVDRPDLWIVHMRIAAVETEGIDRTATIERRFFKAQRELGRPSCVGSASQPSDSRCVSRPVIAPDIESEHYAVIHRDCFSRMRAMVNSDSALRRCRMITQQYADWADLTHALDTLEIPDESGAPFVLVVTMADPFRRALEEYTLVVNNEGRRLWWDYDPIIHEQGDEVCGNMERLRDDEDDEDFNRCFLKYMENPMNAVGMRNRQTRMLAGCGARACSVVYAGDDLAMLDRAKLVLDERVRFVLAGGDVGTSMAIVRAALFGLPYDDDADDDGEGDYHGDGRERAKVLGPSFVETWMRRTTSEQRLRACRLQALDVALYRYAMDKFWDPLVLEVAADGSDNAWIMHYRDTVRGSVCDEFTTHELLNVRPKQWD